MINRWWYSDKGMVYSCRVNRKTVYRGFDKYGGLQIYQTDEVKLAGPVPMADEITDSKFAECDNLIIENLNHEIYRLKKELRKTKEFNTKLVNQLEKSCEPSELYKQSIFI